MEALLSVKGSYHILQKAHSNFFFLLADSSARYRKHYTANELSCILLDVEAILEKNLQITAFYNLHGSSLFSLLFQEPQQNLVFAFPNHQ